MKKIWVAIYYCKNFQIYSDIIIFFNNYYRVNSSSESENNKKKRKRVHSSSSEGSESEKLEKAPQKTIFRDKEGIKIDPKNLNKKSLKQKLEE